MPAPLDFAAIRVQDENGNPVSGAKAYFYQPGTTTPITVYQDSALTTPHATPVVADADGTFSAVYYNGNFKVSVTDADDAVLPGYPLDNLVGAIGTLSAQDGDNVAITGGAIDDTEIGQTTPAPGAFTTLSASGATSVAALSATGAAVMSGPVRFSGLSLAAGSILYSDGSGNLIALAAGAKGKSLVMGATNPEWGSGKILLSTTTISNDATIDLVLDTATYTDFVVELIGVIPVTDDVSFYMRTSTDGGSTFDSGATDYKWTVHTIDGTGAYTQNSAANFNFAGNVGSAAGESGICGEIKIYNPGAATKTRIMATLSYTDSTGAEEVRITGGVRDSAADVDAIRLLFSSGNLESGTVRLWGIV